MIGKQIKNFPCKKCGATYKSYNWLQKHIKTKHPSPTELTQSILRSDQANNTPKKETMSFAEALLSARQTVEKTYHAKKSMSGSRRSDLK